EEEERVEREEREKKVREERERARVERERARERDQEARRKASVSGAPGAASPGDKPGKKQFQFTSFDDMDDDD
ncbi:hypothetical protein IMZ48_05245, partial [Candidatus Bathyarchaeota archaeon]|nr:hypothetical protein [Candidatus Bathyarchaeota archaeon]